MADTKDELKLKQLLDRLQIFHWSPLKPEAYVLPNGSGLGKIAGDSYAAFNLIWAAMPLDNHRDHVKAVSAFSTVKLHMQTSMGLWTLGDVATLATHREFKEYYEFAKPQIHYSLQPIIELGFMRNGI